MVFHHKQWYVALLSGMRLVEESLLLVLSYSLRSWGAPGIPRLLCSTSACDPTWDKIAIGPRHMCCGEICIQFEAYEVRIGQNVEIARKEPRAPYLGHC